ncbi:MAG: ABC transporter permease [Pseudomonadota bacterium]
MSSIDPPQPTRLSPRRVRQPFSSWRAVFALTLREMSTSYGRSPGGYLWAILEPAGGIALMTLIFSVGFRNPPLGADFALFYAGGILPFFFYNDIAMKMGQVVQSNRALLEYPRVTFVDALLARLLLNALTQLMVVAVVLSFLTTITSEETVFDLGKMTLALTMLIVLAAGVGTANAYLIVAFPIWATAWSVMNRPLFLISGIFFLIEAIPEPYQAWLLWNPLVHPIGLMRDAMYPYYQPAYVSELYVFAVGALLMVAGLFLLNRYHRDLLTK